MPDSWVAKASDRAALLVVADRQVAVDVALGEFSLAGAPQWGGVLRGVPVWVNAELPSRGQAWLCFPDGLRRRIRPASQARLDHRGCLRVPFLGEGTSPPEGGERVA
ncbi:hypothetical protein SGFS_081800 [Streptomyces graminofaciens]|uniref:Uncharacterized protein n=1 Tax=Streptomyces graminofaciens TaxID=68212 RepID=A0ABN5VXR1_9ACTN|nr:hypothetical protein SGFS_081800 [Streptomyces graminofaciens]